MLVVKPPTVKCVISTRRAMASVLAPDNAQHASHLMQTEIEWAEAISVHSDSQWVNCIMAWNQRRDRQAAAGVQPTQGTHFEQYARTVIAKQASLFEMRPRPPGSWCTDKSWESNVMRWRVRPPPSPREQSCSGEDQGVHSSNGVPPTAPLGVATAAPQDGLDNKDTMGRTVRPKREREITVWNSMVPERRRSKKKDKNRLRRQQHRWRRREACSGTMEDASSSQDVRLRSNLRTHRHRQSKKVHCVAAS